MLVFEVGKSYSGYSYPVPEGTQAEILPDTILYYFFMNHPTDTEMNEFHKGEAQIRIYYENNVLFFIVKLGDIDWTDAPYSKHLSPSLPDEEYPPAGHGFSVTLAVIDASNQTVQGLRMITLTHKQSRYLIDCLKSQKNVANYDAIIKDIYAKFPTSNSMAENAEP